jgi:hypothetical protein
MLDTGPIIVYKGLGPFRAVHYCGTAVEGFVRLEGLKRTGSNDTFGAHPRML